MVLIIGDNPSILSMNLEFIFPVSLMELDVKLRHSVVNLIFCVQAGYLICSITNIIQSNLAGLLFGQRLGIFH